MLDTRIRFLPFFFFSSLLYLTQISSFFYFCPFLKKKKQHHKKKSKENQAHWRLQSPAAAKPLRMSHHQNRGNSQTPRMPSVTYFPLVRRQTRVPLLSMPKLLYITPSIYLFFLPRFCFPVFLLFFSFVQKKNGGRLCFFFPLFVVFVFALSHIFHKYKWKKASSAI